MSCRALQQINLQWCCWALKQLCDQWIGGDLQRTLRLLGQILARAAGEDLPEQLQVYRDVLGTAVAAHVIPAPE